MERNLFNRFNDSGNRIIPQLTNDWCISPSHKAGFENVFSLKLKQSFLVPFRKIQKDIERLGLSLNNGCLEGKFIFSKNRDLFSEQEYISWRKKIDDIKKLSIKKSNLIPGKSYILENNKEVFFLGTKYVSSFKGTISRKVALLNLNSTHFTTISKKYYFSDIGNNVFEIHNKFIISKSDKTISKTKIERLLRIYNNENPFIAYFMDSCPRIDKYIFNKKRQDFSTIIRD